MGNLIMILSLLGSLPSLDKRSKDNVPVEKTNIPILGHVAEGMTKQELIDAWGKPSHSEKSYNFYAETDDVRYYYENAPCQTVFYGCVVTLEKNHVVSFYNVKGELTE